MSFVGELSEFRLVDLVQTIARAQKSGKLSLSRQHGKGMIVFSKGKIVHATSSSMPRETLGSVLVGEQLITGEQLEKAVEVWRPKRGERRLGEVLTDLGMVAPADLQRVLREQIEKNISECIGWESGFFKFELLDVPAGDGVEVDAEYVLDEGVVAEHVLLSIAVQLDDLEKEGESARETAAAPAAAEPGATAGEVLELPDMPLDDHALFQRHVRDMGSPELTGEVTNQLLEQAKRLFGRGALFVVRAQQFDGVGGFGAQSGSTGEAVPVRRISLPSGRPSIIREVVEKNEAYCGPMPFLPANRQLLRDLGGASPTDVAALPVSVNGSVRLVFYGDHLREAPPSGWLDRLELALAQTGHEMEKQLLADHARELDERRDRLE